MALRKYIKPDKWKSTEINGFPLFPRDYFLILKNQGLVFMPNYCIDDEFEDDDVLAWAEARYIEEVVEDEEEEEE